MNKVYCDTGAYNKDIKTLEKEGIISVYQFKYENKNRNIKNIAIPSSPSYCNVNYSWKELSGFSWRDMSIKSNKWAEILKIVGVNNKIDAKHLDSAFMTGCQAFITSDRGDIVSHKEEIQKMLGISVFHYPSEISDFISFVKTANKSLKDAP